MQCRLIRDTPSDGVWNMAVDEAVLRHAAAGDAPTLRLYGWKSATLSLGYFQSLADRARHGPSADCPVVRRSSGGGALVHDRELTYSLVIPRRERLAEHRIAGLQLYQIVHESLVDALAALAVAASLYGPVSRDPSRKEKAAPFLCFERRTAGDVIVEGHKIAGSAQRRNREAILQHGSVLIDRSPAAPELPGLVQLARPQVSLPDLIAAWTPMLAQALAVRLEDAQITPGELELARQLASERFQAADWTMRR
jgi:lipoate-protein ligase A